LVNAHKIPYHEKKLGQLFCNQSAGPLLKMLLDECKKSKVDIKLSTKIKGYPKKDPEYFILETDKGEFFAKNLVVATGGISFPKIGASDLGYRIARHFGIKVTELSPALDGFVLGEDYNSFKKLSGLSLDCILTCENGIAFRENILFTHKGITGPAALQGSLQWNPGESIFINVLPDLDVRKWLKENKNSSKHIKNLLSDFLPIKFCEFFCEIYFPLLDKISQANSKTLSDLSEKLKNWRIIPSKTVGYLKAEVTKGGVDTSEISSKTMESKKVPGLYFIGEVLDVTGWLGGYNFQWAWASAYAAAMNL
jgi:predicted Rossmann fold flavoprotein